MDETPAPPEPARRRALGAIVGGAIVVALIALLAIGLANRDIGTSIQDALAEGERPDAPDLALPVLTGGDGVRAGETVALDELRDRIVVVNFWASWCEPCRDESPVLEAVAARYRGGGGVLVLGANVQDRTDDARRFIEQYGLTYPSVREGGDRAKRDWQVRALPETFVVDTEGRVALKITGPVTEEAQLTTAIEQLRAEPEGA